MDFKDVEAQGFLIYCMAIRNFQAKKASFSTYLFTNLSGRLLDYCKQKMAIEGLDNFDSPFDEFCNLWEARESGPSLEWLLSHAQSHISPNAYRIYEWILRDQLVEFRSKSNPSLISVAKALDMPLGVVQTCWRELSYYWNTKGAVLFSA